MAKNTGLPYELFVQQLQQYIINNENSLGIKQVVVEHNKIITDMHGNARQFDLYWEFEFAGNIYKTVIECKDYASPITIDKIDAFLGKTHDIPGLKLIYATKTGYQSGAKNKAQAHNIELLIIKEGESYDWIDNDGNYLISQINLEMTAITSPSIYAIHPTFNKQFVETNKIDIDMAVQKIFQQLATDLYIHYATDKKRISIHDLSNQLPNKIKNMQYGKGSYEEEYPDFYLEVPTEDISIKMRKIKVDYEFNEPITTTNAINLSDSLLGVIKNITKNNQTIIFKDGTVR